jgi:hypothetical protein
MQPTNPGVSGPPRVSVGQSSARRDQLVGLALMLLCLAGVFVIQPLLTRLRTGTQDEAGKVVQAGIVPPPPAALNQMAAEFPRLTLGGFRGLLVPFLWKQAEDDKNERRWQDLDTTYNIIGKLQPYFVAVYKFNAWNQAYNLSAQWHGIDEKYQWVLEGLTHLYEGEQYSPHNADILLEEAQMYFLKLGGSFERIEYRQMWRDGIAHQFELGDNPEAGVTSPGTTALLDRHRRVRQFILMPQFRATLLEDPRNPQKQGYGVRIAGLRQKPDGTDDPVEFRYGLSPFYFAYIEYKRCLALGTPTSTGLQVIHAYPAMSLRLWCRDDDYYAQGKVCGMFFRSKQGEEAPAPEDIPDFDNQVMEIRDCYRNVQMVAPMAVQAFLDHLAVFPQNHNIHDKHILETKFLAQIADAESTMFEGLVSYYVGEGKTQRVLTPAARERLQASLPKYQAAVAGIQDYMDRTFPIRNNVAPQDRADYAKYQEALQGRVEGVRALLAAGPKDRIDFSFLWADTVER